MDKPANADQTSIQILMVSLFNPNFALFSDRKIFHKKISTTIDEGLPLFRCFNLFYSSLYLLFHFEK